MDDLKKEMLKQDNRSTSFPIFIVVEDQRIYHIQSSEADGHERAEDLHWQSSVELGNLCEKCDKKYLAGKKVPDECDECSDDAFIWYKTERDIPNMRAAFFFTAAACNAHIEANRHHYNKTAHSYAISAYHNWELRKVMEYLSGESSG